MAGPYRRSPIPVPTDRYCGGRGSNSRPLSRKSDALTTRLPNHLVGKLFTALWRNLQAIWCLKFWNIKSGDFHYRPPVQILGNAHAIMSTKCQLQVIKRLESVKKTLPLTPAGILQKHLVQQHGINWSELIITIIIIIIIIIIEHPIDAGRSRVRLVVQFNVFEAPYIRRLLLMEHAQIRNAPF